MERPRAGQLGHTCIRVKSIDATVKLYHDLLGMPVVETRPGMAALGSPENYIEVFERKADEVPAGAPSSNQALPLNHFSLWVEQIEELEQRLATAGYPFTNGAIRHSPNWVQASLKVGWIKDPDGNRVELLEWAGPTEPRS